MKWLCRELSDTDMLETSLRQMQAGECSTLPVFHDGQLIGLLSSDNLSQWLNVHAARGSKMPPRSASVAPVVAKHSLSN